MSVFPMQAPRYAVYMMLDEPHGNASTGGYSTAGQVAAPAAGKVIARVGPIMGLMPDIKDAPEIEQALSIPLQPAHGLVLGPIKVTEPSTDPQLRRPEAMAVPAPSDGLQPVQAPGGKAEPTNPPARPASVPAHLSKPGLVHKVQTGPGHPAPASARPQTPAEAPEPEWLHKTGFNAAPGYPVLAPSETTIDPAASGLLHAIRFDAVSDGPVSDGPVSDGPVSDGPVSVGPASDAPHKGHSSGGPSGILALAPSVAA
jgi:hypothetical protein